MRPVRSFAIGMMATVACLQVASAVTLPTAVPTLGAGAAVVSPCDSDGFSFRYAVDTSGKITTVAVGSIAGVCAGGTLRVALTNGNASVGSGSAALPSVGFSGSAVIALSPAPASNQVTAAYAAIEGP